jgi:hypothetical protein
VVNEEDRPRYFKCLHSSTSDGRSGGTVRLQTKGHGVCFVFVCALSFGAYATSQWSYISRV